MIVTAWIIFIGFGIIGLTLFWNFIFNEITIKTAVILMIAIFVVAIVAGAIFGGLILL